MRYIIVICFLFPISAFGQIQLSFSTGYGSYSMSPLKKFQEEIKAEFPVEPRITESFPSFWYFEGLAISPVKENYFAGLALTYGSTAGRIHYQDYSGEITADQLVNYFSIGSPLGVTLNPGNNSISFQFDFRPTLVFSNLDLKFQSMVDGQEETESHRFNSLNIALQPGLIVTKKIGAFGLVLQTGYNFTAYSGKLFFKEDQKYYLLNNSGDKINTDWTGLRVAFGVSFSFKTD